jgi:hypothetical protein
VLPRRFILRVGRAEATAHVANGSSPIVSKARRKGAGAFRQSEGRREGASCLSSAASRGGVRLSSLAASGPGSARHALSKFRWIDQRIGCRHIVVTRQSSNGPRAPCKRFPRHADCDKISPKAASEVNYATARLHRGLGIAATWPTLARAQHCTG